MHLKSLIREALAGLKRNLIRSTLTILGIAVGVGAFICVVAIGNAGTARIQDQLENLGDNFIWIEAGSRAKSGIRIGSRGTKTLILDDAKAIMDQVPDIKAMTPNVDGHVQIVFGNENWNTVYRGVSPEFLEIRRWKVRLGAFFTQADVETASPVCVLGQTVVNYLFDGENPVDQTIRVNAMPCKVIGVLAPKGANANGQDQDDFVIMPYTTAQKRISGNPWLDDIFCSAVSREAMPRATAQIISLLRERHHLSAKEDLDFNIRSPEDVIRAQLAMATVMEILLASVASLSLVVGGIGIMNIMLVSVTQRTREIGIRMAVGATEGDVQMQFLGEAVILGVLGGLIGMAVGLLSSNLVQTMFQFPTKLTPQIFAIGALFSAGVGVLFGYYPARKASQLDPIQGLRYE